jgi:hypothetical protein
MLAKPLSKPSYGVSSCGSGTGSGVGCQGGPAWCGANCCPHLPNLPRQPKCSALSNHLEKRRGKEKRDGDGEDNMGHVGRGREKIIGEIEKFFLVEGEIEK